MGSDIFRDFYNFYWICNAYKSNKGEDHIKKGRKHKFYKLCGNNTPIDSRHSFDSMFGII